VALFPAVMRARTQGFPLVLGGVLGVLLCRQDTLFALLIRSFSNP
jgi:hypothetical protein